jgi:hypothetical protein
MHEIIVVLANMRDMYPWDRSRSRPLAALGDAARLTA